MKSNPPLPEKRLTAPPLMVHVEDLAEELRVSPRHVYRMHSRGELPPAKRLGKLLRWTRSEIEEWLAAGCPKSTPVA